MEFYLACSIEHIDTIDLYIQTVSQFIEYQDHFSFRVRYSLNS